MRILAIGGEPGVGKSTLMRSLLDTLLLQRRQRYGLLDYSEYLATPAAGVLVLGYYEPGQPFGGTDRLSMAVQPNAEEFVRKEADGFSANSLAFEGDRLFSEKFLTVCQASGELKVCLVEAQPAIVAARRAARATETGKAQDETWLKGRISKVQNVGKWAAGQGCLERVRLDDPAETPRAAARLRSWLVQ